MMPVRTQAIAPILLLMCSGAVTPSAQQVLFSRVVYVSVTDPLNRFVTGLDREDFQVIENGVPRPITDFPNSLDSPMSIALVSGAPVSTQALAETWAHGVPVDLTQAQSLSEALRQLAGSKNPRKALVIVGPVDAQQIPADIEAFRADLNIWQKVVIELRNQYVVRFESQAPSASVEVVIRQPRGLPPLKPHWQ
jgi:hypothetical protein